MNISDLSYQEIATETAKLEGGIATYDLGTEFFQHIQSIGAVSMSNGAGSYVASNVYDLTTCTTGGLYVTF